LGALLRRAAPAAVPADGALELDPSAHAVRHGGEQVMLTPTEFRLLAALTAQRGTVLRRGELISAAWPVGAIVHENTLDAYAARIRRKLREVGAPEALETVRGVGYVLR